MAPPSKNQEIQQGKDLRPLILIALLIAGIYGNDAFEYFVRIFRSSNEDPGIAQTQALGVIPEPQKQEMAPLDFRPIAINSASKELLMTVKGVGPVLAGDIVAYRQQHGPIMSPGDLMKVRGVGKKRAERLRHEFLFAKQ